jgi:hypothetical protein
MQNLPQQQRKCTGPTTAVGLWALFGAESRASNSSRRQGFKQLLKLCHSSSRRDTASNSSKGGIAGLATAFYHSNSPKRLLGAMLGLPLRPGIEQAVRSKLLSTTQMPVHSMSHSTAWHGMTAESASCMKVPYESQCISLLTLHDCQVPHFAHFAQSAPATPNQSSQAVLTCCCADLLLFVQATGKCGCPAGRYSKTVNSCSDW